MDGIMNYLSVSSGIEAASVAWNPLGFKPIGFSEIAPFPCSVLAHHFPDVPNFGDMNGFEEWPIEPGSVDILVGGTPCQSFSIAGLRGGLEDERGNLALTYCRILQKFKPRWFVWENVPGVISSYTDAEKDPAGETNDTEEVWQSSDFATLLTCFRECGYSVAGRILDAQHFGVPQRRRRIFVVGHSGDWRRAAEVLFEPGCVPGDSKKGRKKKSAVAALTATGVGTCGADDNQGQAGHLIPADYQCHGSNVGPMGTLRTGNGNTAGGVPFVTHALRGEGFDASEDGTGRGTPLIAISTGDKSHCLNAGGMGRQDYETETMVVQSFRTAGDGAVYDSGDKTAPLTTATDPSSNIICFSGRNRGDDGRGYERGPNVTGDIAGTVDTVKPGNVAGPSIGVRRLTPLECERLQGFPPGWTAVPHRGKPACDGPRYKAIGNSFAVPVVKWIGSRIQISNRKNKQP